MNLYLHPSVEDRVRMVKVMHGGADTTVRLVLSGYPG